MIRYVIYDSLEEKICKYYHYMNVDGITNISFQNTDDDNEQFHFESFDIAKGIFLNAYYSVCEDHPEDLEKFNERYCILRLNDEGIIDFTIGPIWTHSKTLKEKFRT